jgi:hypothetical protein
VAVTVKLPEPAAVPPEVVMDTEPVADPGITIPTRVVPVLDTTMAAVPPMVKAVGVPRLVPVMVTKVPGLPLVGLNPLMVGACAQTLAAGTEKIRNRKMEAKAKIDCLYTLFICRAVVGFCYTTNL